VLLAPEALAVEPALDAIPAQAEAAADPKPAGAPSRERRYAEAYAEMAHYNAVAAAHQRSLKASAVAASVAPALEADARARGRFPDPSPSGRA